MSRPSDRRAIQRRRQFEGNARHGVGIMVAAAMCFAAGCASSGKLSLVAATPTAAAAAGNAVTSERQHVVTMRLLKPSFSRRTADLPALHIAVTNRGAKPFEFSAADVTVRGASGRVRVYSAYEYEALFRKEAAFQRYAIAVREQQHEAMTQMTQNAGEPAAILGKTNALRDNQLATAEERRLAAGLHAMLYPKLVQPGETFGGVVRLAAQDMPSGPSFTVLVNAAGEVHEFTLSIVR